ncbi:hypothetical protein ONS95_001609 [Cadophora gregata]|uniref:uncharacterized protein n=1 Tax=Cadophora gregata TaxID=51156 RepID=UPI0026DD7824|nr:uncharacterized protein ONS95_001609 [Cadophora gregata]KAK0111235.1 hypothetical protein ONS95_001609 [Cadophora gregata]KAK0112292.1 hypothetical protein ONS96_001540 [Cadophora gregata f. sp. sojae]
MYLQRSRFGFRKRLHMITGIRIARGARRSSKSSTTRGGNAKTMVDLTAVGGAPLKVGPEFEVTREKEGAYSFEGAQDFVYAYRVCEVHYGKSVYTKAYNKGDSFADGKNAGEEGLCQEDNDEDKYDDGDKDIPQILVENIAKQDFAGTAGTDVTVLRGEEDEQFILALKTQMLVVKMVECTR